MARVSSPSNMTEADSEVRNVRRRRGQKKSKDLNEKRVVHDKDPAAKEMVSGNANYKPHKTLLVNLNDEAWYECGRNTPGRDDILDSGKRNSVQVVTNYRNVSYQIYQQEVALFKESSSGGGGGGDERWVENTIKRGTLKDRVAAMSVVISTNPVHNLYALDMLLGLAGGTGQSNVRVAQMAGEALADLFSNTLLPSHRKLVALDYRPFHLYEPNTTDGSSTQRTLSPRILLLWRVEEIIKTKYTAFLNQYLVRTLNESTTLDLNKSFTLRIAAGLLRDVPEGEQILLSMMVNKIGDPSKKIAAAAGHQLRLVLIQHPKMVTVVAREVQQLAHRPHLSSRALYNCIVFLNQLKLVKDYDVSEDSKVTNDRTKSKNPSSTSSLSASLIKTYFSLFEVAVKAEGKDNNAMKSRLLSALLTGVNRAHPYLPDKDSTMEEHIDALYRITHIAPPAACTQAFMLLFQLAVGESVPRHYTMSEALEKRKSRFYRALYSKVGDPAMLAGRQLTMFFNLVYKAMKNDSNDFRVVAFAKRLLHTTLHSSAASIAGSLLLFSEVMKYQPALEQSFFASNNHAIFDPTKREPSAAFSEEKNPSLNEKDTSLLEKEKKCCQKGGLWEVTLAAHHYHPSVAKFSSTLGEISYGGDPLRDFTLSPFLDKFAFRNAKSVANISKQMKRGESIGERRSGLEGGILALGSLPVNDPSFLERKNVGEADNFFLTFFVERAKRDKTKGTAVRSRESNVKDIDAKDLKRKALESAEHKKVAGLDSDEEEDSDEAEFARTLAEKMIESGGNGMANFDDEDPDMERWEDTDSDDCGGEEKIGRAIINGSDDDNDRSVDGGDADRDTFMEVDSSGSNDDDADIGAFEDLENTDSEKDEEKGEDLNDEGNDDEAVDQSTIVLSKKDNSNTKKEKLLSSFDDASKYEQIIAKSWTKKRERSDENTLDNNEMKKTNTPSSSGQASLSNGMRKKRQTRKKKKTAEKFIC